MATEYVDTTADMTIEQVRHANAMRGGADFLRSEIESALQADVSMNDLAREPKQSYTLEEVSALLKRCVERAKSGIDSHCRAQ